MSSSPPALPPRKSSGEERNVLSMHTSDEKSNGNGRTSELSIGYSMNDDLSTIGFVRQFEGNTSPKTIETSEYFQDSHRSINFQHNLEIILKEKPELSEDPSVEFWSNFIKSDIVELIKERQVESLFEYIARGIPCSLRALVYFKVLNLKYSLDNENYSLLLKKAESYEPEAEMKDIYDCSSLDASTKEVLRVFKYYITQITPNVARNIPPDRFFIQLADVLSSLKYLEKGDLMSLFVRLNRIFIHLIKDEFYYKANRSLEDFASDQFNHIVRQGINLKNLYKSSLFGFFAGQITDKKILLQMLDFIIFEGFDYFHRVIVIVVNANKGRIMSLNGDDLAKFIMSSEFFNVLSCKENLPGSVSLASALQIKPSIIKYENEFHLLHSVSLNRNDTELRGLKEMNDELTIKIHDLNQLLDNLKSTHSEIMNQGDTFYSELQNAEKKNRDLLLEKEKLDQKYEHLTMKENLNNTIKANEEFAARNNELELQVNDLKLRVGKKKAQLAKFSSAE